MWVCKQIFWLPMLEKKSWRLSRQLPFRLLEICEILRLAELLMHSAPWSWSVMLINSNNRAFSFIQLVRRLSDTIPCSYIVYGVIKKRRRNVNVCIYLRTVRTELFWYHSTKTYLICGQCASNTTCNCSQCFFLQQMGRGPPILQPLGGGEH
jgi:hypothetical protein